MRFAAVVFSTVWCLFVLYISHAGLGPYDIADFLVVSVSDQTFFLWCSPLIQKIVHDIGRQ